MALGSERAVSRVTLVDDIQLPPDARRAIQAVATSRARLARDKRLLSKAMNKATRRLLDTMGLSVRDTGELLDLSHQRIQQLKPPARARA